MGNSLIINLKSKGGRVQDIQEFIDKIKSLPEATNVIVNIDSLPTIGRVDPEKIKDGSKPR